MCMLHWSRYICYTVVLTGYISISMSHSICKLSSCSRWHIELHKQGLLVLSWILGYPSCYFAFSYPWRRVKRILYTIVLILDWIATLRSVGTQHMFIFNSINPIYLIVEKGPPHVHASALDIWDKMTLLLITFPVFAIVVADILPIQH